jgi:hypothetical protein
VYVIQRMPLDLTATEAARCKERISKCNARLIQESQWISPVPEFGRDGIASGKACASQECADKAMVSP